MTIRHEKVITKIAKVNQKVVIELEKIAKLSKDLAGRHYNQPFLNSFASSATHKKGGGNPRGGGFTPRGRREQRWKFPVQKGSWCK